MQALLKSRSEPGFTLSEVPDPECRADEVVVRVLRTGICGTDLHIYAWDDWAAGAVRAPLVPGHEFFGEVVEVGDGVRDVRVGDRVSGEGHIVCGTCRNCRAGRRQMCIRTIGLGLQRDGAFAELLAIPASNVWVHSHEIAPELGAIFDPLGNAVHTALAFPLVGEDVLVSGCGPIGLMSIAVARHVGARYIVATDVSPARLALAADMGANDAVDVSRERISRSQETLCLREGFDIGFEMSGAPGALPEMIENMNHGGRIAMLGLSAEPYPIDWSKVVTHMLTLSGIYGREMFETWNAMASMLQTSETLRERISSVIAQTLPAREWEAGFAAARSGATGKIILDWTAL
ncbi:L-threonine 3-dehydrogenase [Leucobacter rhizosphaerae]|uniref:L-threonine 3-dehydrogenase n=1 Tax=Leucobacter rhizosphaerae TaxID=2932245 RepID=A0ABY4FUR5_9MICO|nr:L-threonine 3-dehydrogenase [Leucobacter rhizosphaerae]UOQ60017.1 L-threonine 3-dehydrogenase [Leucobacter rhizosphaerae]